MLIKNAVCALPLDDVPVRADIRITGEKIAEVALHLSGLDGEEVLDAQHLEIFPGAIDPHVHFDEPGFTHREDFFHGSMAAARGGVTSVIDMPCTSLPPVTTLDNLRAKLAAMGNRSVVDFALYGGISGNRIEEALASDMAALAPFVVGFKCYFISGMDSFSAVDHYGFGRALERAASLGRPLLVHAEDPGIVLPATAAMRKRAADQNRDATWADYCDSRPESAELSAVASALACAGRNAHALHIVHVGTAEAAELASAGLPGGDGGATCETCPQYLAFSRDDFGTLGSALKTAPPVKTAGHAARLWKLLADGKISFAASDHAPAPPHEKHTGSPWTDYGGIPGTGTLFPYLYSAGYRQKKLDMRSFVRATSGAAAERYGLSGAKGSIKPGMDADLAFIDPRMTHAVRGGELLSRGTITPFEGMVIDGSVRMTMVRGRFVWLAAEAERSGNPEDGIRVGAGYGKNLVWGCM